MEGSSNLQSVTFNLPPPKAGEGGEQDESEDMEPKEKGELVLNARHAEALREAKERIRCGLGGLKSGQPTELVASELHIALSAFGSITGKIDNEAVLDKLFATFCIGK